MCGGRRCYLSSLLRQFIKLRTILLCSESTYFKAADIRRYPSCRDDDDPRPPTPGYPHDAQGVVSIFITSRNLPYSPNELRFAVYSELKNCRFQDLVGDRWSILPRGIAHADIYKIGRAPRRQRTET